MTAGRGRHVIALREPPLCPVTGLLPHRASHQFQPTPAASTAASLMATSREPVGHGPESARHFPSSGAARLCSSMPPIHLPKGTGDTLGPMGALSIPYLQRAFVPAEGGPHGGHASTGSGTGHCPLTAPRSASLLPEPSTSSGRWQATITAMTEDGD